MKYSKRIKILASYTKGYNKLADIGTDHAHLVCFSLINNYVSNALACDVAKGPLNAAKENVLKNNLENKVEFILANGISKIDDNVDVVVISGMGGSLIKDILLNDKEKLKNVKRIILQPNIMSENIRKILKEINFKIVDEKIIKENNRYYEIIICDKGKFNMLYEEIIFGPILLKEKSNIFKEFWNNELIKKQKILKKINSDQEKIEEIKKRINLIEEVIKQ